MPDRDYYFFFDRDAMPIAVFLTHTKAEAFDLFGRLYGRVWSDSVKLGITIEKEKGVPAERWDEIHDKYIARTKPKLVAPVIKPAPIRLEIKKNEYSSTGLDTAKYMSKM